MKVLVLALITLLAAGGNILGATKKYTYDAAGRLIRVDYGNGKGFSYRYDANGNLLSRTPLDDSEPARRRPARRGAAKQEKQEKQQEQIQAPPAAQPAAQ